MFIWLYRGAVSLLLCALAWQVYIYGMGNLAGEAVEQQLPWQYQTIKPYYRPNADTLVASAERAKEDGKEQVSEQLSLQALAENPSSGRAASHLLSLYINTHQTDEEKTAEIASLAAQLWPAHTYTHTRLADYWIKQQRLDKLIPEWNVLLTRLPGIRSQIFPGLYNITSKPEYTPLLQPYIDTPPVWWNSFFAFLSREAGLEFLKETFAKRLFSPTPLDDSERSAYVNRLLKEKLWQEAHEAWAKTLGSEQQKLNGLIYDSGFEGESYNTGFDWNIWNTKEVSIKPGITYGMKGQKALHISFTKNKSLNFRHLSQRLTLATGDYQLSFNYRLDNFKNTQGLVWRIRCLDEKNTVIAETSALKGQKPWSTLNTEFSIPASECSAQQLKLETASRYRHDWNFAGSLWFDDISVTSIKREKNDE